MFKFKKITKCLFVISLFLTIFQGMIYPVKAAGSVSITPSKSNVAPGETFTVTVTVNGGSYKIDAINVSNGSSSANSLGMIDSTSDSFSVTAGSAGTTSITVIGPFATYEPESEDPNYSVSTSVNVVAPTSGGGNAGGNAGNSGGSSPSNQTPTNKDDDTTPTEKKSNDASLSELTISHGTLSPEFKLETTEYTVSLAKDVTTLSISAKANDAKASVTGTGEQTLKAGENELSVVCTAEDGTTRTYKIKASVDEAPTSFIPYNDKKLGVVRDTSSVTIPTGFEEMKVTLDGNEVTAWKNPLNNLVIVYMIDDTNEKNFYLFDEKNKQITSVYKPMALLGRNIAVIDIPSELQTKKGMKFQEVEVDGVKLQGWMFEDSAFANYTLLYVMDEQGKMVYYLHEKSENTLQLYSNQAALSQDAYDTLVNDQEEALQQRMWMILALLITNVFTILLFLISKMKRKKRIKNNRANNNIQRERNHKMYDEPILAMDEDESASSYSSQEEGIDDDKSIKITPYENQEDLFEEEN